MGPFAVLIPVLGVSLTTATAIGLGLAYGVALTVVGAVLWMRIVLAMEPEPATVGLFLFFHLVYGAVLGGWVPLGLV